MQRPAQVSVGSTMGSDPYRAGTQEKVSGPWVPAGVGISNATPYPVSFPSLRSPCFSSGTLSLQKLPLPSSLSQDSSWHSGPGPFLSCLYLDLPSDGGISRSFLLTCSQSV